MLHTWDGSDSSVQFWLHLWDGCLGSISSNSPCRHTHLYSSSESALWHSVYVANVPSSSNKVPSGRCTVVVLWELHVRCSASGLDLWTQRVFVQQCIYCLVHCLFDRVEGGMVFVVTKLTLAKSNVTCM